MKKAMMLFLTLIVILGGLGVVSAADGDFSTNSQLDNNGNLNEANDNGINEDNHDLKDKDKEDCDDDDDNQCDDEDDEECDEDYHDYHGTAAIGDRVWNDSNANGIQDVGEQGIANVTVNLWKGNETNPIKQIATTKTDENGNYYFKNLIKSIYWLEFIAPTATDGTWIFSPQDQGTDNWIDSDPNASGIAGPINVNEYKYCPTWDAGLYQYATLGDFVWMDTNKNGIQDPGEPGIAGVIVNLWTGNATGPLVKTVYSTVTDANGNYIFTNLVPGIYWLEFILPNSTSGFFTLQNQGLDDAIDSDVNSTGFAGPIELLSGEVDLTWDAGVDPGSAAGGEEEENGAAGGEEEIIEIVDITPEEVAAAGEEVPLQETGVPILPGVLAALMIGGGLLGRKLRK